MLTPYHESSWCGTPRRIRLGVVAAAAFAVVELAVAPLAWSAPESAVGLGATYQPKTTFTDVSCTTATDCTAVGSLGEWQGRPDMNYSPNFEPMFATETAGVWGKAIGIPAPSSLGVFTGVSCPSATDCTAVGFDYSGQTGLHGFAEIGYPIYATETHGTWSSATDLTAGTGQGVTSAASFGFNSVSCTSAKDCTAVGNGPMYATETNGKWGPATFVGTPAAGGDFSGVSCTSATDCTAVGDDETFDGNYGFYSDNLPIYATESSGTWGASAEILAPGFGGSTFNGISCSSATTCTGVGSFPGGAFYATESAGTWAPATEVTLPSSGDLTGISCTDATSCTAVGDGSDTAFGPVDDESIHLTETAGVWGSASVNGGGGFSNVSCPSTTACTAVGSFDVCANANYCEDPGSYPVYATESAGAWQTAPAPPRIGRVSALDREIKVSWTAAASRRGPAVIGYIATATVSVHGTVHEFVCSTGRTSCTITHLTNGRTYAVTVIARSAVGSSPISSKRTARPRP